MKAFSPNDLGKQILVEDCQRLSITTYLNIVKEKLKKELLCIEIKKGNLNIELIPSKTTFDGVRYWFKCPMCLQRVGILFVHPLSQSLGCRKCLALEYRSRRYKGMIENKLF